jgi:monovalent cation/hydrogen antiporter
MGAVAMTAHALIDGLPWAAAFALGAIVAPTDPLAATAIARRLGVPRRLVTILEGESLVNDATALVAYRIAVTAAVGGSFVAWQAGLRFWSARPVAWPSGSWSAGWSWRSAAGSTTPRWRSCYRWPPATPPTCRPTN